MSTPYSPRRTLLVAVCLIVGLVIAKFIQIGLHRWFP